MGWEGKGRRVREEEWFGKGEMGCVVEGKRENRNEGSWRKRREMVSDWMRGI